MPLQPLALQVLMVQSAAPETLKYPRPQLVELTVPCEVVRLLLAVRKPAKPVFQPHLVPLTVEPEQLVEESRSKPQRPYPLAVTVLHVTPLMP